MLKVGHPAPHFSLPDQDNNTHTLEDYYGSWLVIFFYPKDHTPGCTKEACNFRDSHQDILDLGAKVIGVSKDSSKTHHNFATKHQLLFPLLSDKEASMIKAYQAWGPKKLFGKEYMGIKRVSYILDPTTNIAASYPKVNPLTHTQQVIQDLEKLVKDAA